MIDRNKFEIEYEDEIEELEMQMMLTAIGIEKSYEALKETNLPEDLIEKILVSKNDK